MLYQLADVAKWREDIHTRTGDKQWRENANHAWHISPTLAVFLPIWLNNSPVGGITFLLCIFILCNFQTKKNNAIQVMNPSMFQVFYNLINHSYCQVLVSEVCKLTSSQPTKVTHIPQALDFFLSDEMLEKDDEKLPHLLTWARCSPLRQVSSCALIFTVRIKISRWQQFNFQQSQVKHFKFINLCTQ